MQRIATCPWCERMRGVLADADAYAMEVYRSSALGQSPDPGQFILQRTALGIPQNVGQVSKPSKFLYEEYGIDEPKAKRRATKKDRANRKAMSKALKNVNGRARKKNGQLKKGWTQSKIMSAAHKECRRKRK